MSAKTTRVHCMCNHVHLLLPPSTGRREAERSKGNLAAVHLKQLCKERSHEGARWPLQSYPSSFIEVVTCGHFGESCNAPNRVKQRTAWKTLHATLRQQRQRKLGQETLENALECACMGEIESCKVEKNKQVR